MQYLGVTPFLKLFFTFGLSLFDSMQDKKHTFDLAISFPKEVVLILYLMTFFVAIGQNKKEQILLLTEERDSLQSLLNSERSASDLRIKELNSRIAELDSVNIILHKELDSKKNLIKSVSIINDSLNEKVSKVTNEILLLKNDLYLLHQQLINLKTIQNSKLENTIDTIESPTLRVEKVTNSEELNLSFWQITLNLSDKVFSVSIPWEDEPIEKIGTEISIINEVWDRRFYISHADKNKVIVKLSFHMGGTEEEEIEMESVYVNLGNSNWILQNCDGLCFEE